MAKVKSIPAIIDPLLIKGGHTMGQLTSVIRRKKLANPEIEWYVYDRMYALRQDGYKINKDAKGRFRAVK